MSRLGALFCLAAVVLCSLCPVSRCSEKKQPARSSSAASKDRDDLAIVRSLLGESAETSTTPHFAIIHEPGANYVSGTGKTLEQAYKQFYAAFSDAGFELVQSPDRLIWVCFPQQSRFNEYARQVEGTDLSWLDGYYSTLTNRVAVVEPSPRVSEPNKAAVPPKSNRWTDSGTHRQRREDVLPMSADESQVDKARLTHELAHQLAFNSGLQKRGVMYPFWVSEGLATNFEFEGPMGGGFENCSTARRDCLLKSCAAGELTPLAEFVVQTNVPAGAAQSRRYYAQAWAFFQYLLTERSENLRHYLHVVAALSPGRRRSDVLLREFTNAFGTPEEMEPSWDAFLDRQAQLARVEESSSSAARN